MNIQDSVNIFYQEKGISAIDFKCPHIEQCRGNHKDFTTAKEAYIGEKYGTNGVPKLLFLSLDSGDSRKEDKKRTMEFIRNKENDREKLEKPNTHWAKTFNLASSLLKDFIKQKINKIEINKYFAHINSAKCCQNKKGNAQADTILFKNCREFIGQEIEILNPDIIITQGEQAKKTLEHNAFKVCKINNRKEVQMQENSKKILWFHSTHPTAWQGGNFRKCEDKNSSNLDDNNAYFDKWRNIINSYMHI